jgi:hypothetical protein
VHPCLVFLPRPSLKNFLISSNEQDRTSDIISLLYMDRISLISNLLSIGIVAFVSYSTYKNRRKITLNRKNAFKRIGLAVYLLCVCLGIAVCIATLIVASSSNPRDAQIIVPYIPLLILGSSVVTVVFYRLLKNKIKARMVASLPFFILFLLYIILKIRSGSF